jgi:hypothetical protein
MAEAEEDIGEEEHLTVDLQILAEAEVRVILEETAHIFLLEQLL